ncbi:Uncharacterised protein [Cedecea neteri]|uniref:Uncharacterized protein n=1 Tax=Cedecea neteri TaxID=158822 RepID=A0A2X2T4F7_9ENTR|nr:Uncharacterised protein [Cedecea neteri]
MINRRFPVHKGIDHFGKRARLQLIHQLGEVGHFLLVMACQQRIALHGITVFRQRIPLWRRVRSSSRISL